jgi:hypothetical protein
LSDRNLTLIEATVLNKGLNFCITNKNKGNIHKTIDTDILKFTRTLQLRHLFGNSADNIVEKFTGNPGWQPPQSKCSPSISGFTTYIQNHLKKLVSVNKIKHNISSGERKAINNLREDKNILIQKADKGGSIVIVNTKDYLNKMINMLNDPITYTQVLNVNLEDAKSKTDNIFLHLHDKNYISSKQKNYLMRCNPKMPILYGLPKIHKNNWPYRPIVSQIDSPAYKLNKYLDYLLTTAEKCIPNLLQDTTKFLQIINKLDSVPDNCILFTIDVTSLYTVLPHELVINYVQEMYIETLENWIKYTPDIKPVPNPLIAEMIKIILNQTFFSFNNNLFLQNYGITMGAPSSVKLANITLYKHLNKILKDYPKTLPLIQLRLIDDIFGIWGGTEEELLEWVQFLNNSHTSIKFTLEFSKIEIPFLDTLVYIDNNKIKTKLYKKPTDNKQYLHFNSEHPAHIKKAIPYAQALRYRRIIEDDEILKLELDKLKSNFISRNYPVNILDTALDRVSNLNRLDIIKYKEKVTNNWNSIPLILTFNNSLVSNNNINIYKKLTESWIDLLKTTPELRMLDTPKIVFRKGTTINSLLNSTVFPPIRWSTERKAHIKTIPLPDSIPITPMKLGHCKPCCKARCKTCEIISTSDSFISSHLDVSFNLLDNFDCGSSNIVYLITCTKCNIQYVGETGQSLRERFNAHRSDILLNKNTPVGIHFNSINHNASHLLVIPIEKLDTSSNINNRRTREYFWQLKLNTIFPKGLNNFPVDERTLFENLEICSVTDLELFDNLTYLALTNNP